MIRLKAHQPYIFYHHLSLGECDSLNEKKGRVCWCQCRETKRELHSRQSENNNSCSQNGIIKIDGRFSEMPFVHSLPGSEREMMRLYTLLFEAYSNRARRLLLNA
jgi:hypothetical protein